jgi:HD-like signal output (HDOD) protein
MTPNEIIAKVKNLPTVSQAALRLVGLLDQPAISNDDVVVVLKYDNVLTAKLLRACNSPYFGFDEQISSVEQAVLILGHQQILHMVLSLAFGGVMSTSLPGYAIEAKELWSHSLTTAVAAEQLVKSGLPIETEPPVAFTAGLLHDIGKLALNQVLDVGAQLAIRDEIVEAVANHHQPVTAPEPKLSAIIHVSDCLVHQIGSNLGWDSYAIIADARANEALGITPDKLEGLMISVHDSAAQVEHFMNLA